MRNRDYHLYLTDTEYSRIVTALINLKNDLIAQGRYTDGVDDTLCKVTSAKKQKMKIFYIQYKRPLTIIRVSGLDSFYLYDLINVK